MSKAKIRPAPAILWPTDVQHRYGISATSRWRWEKTGRLPPRDFFLAGKAEGWHRATLDAADRGEQVVA
jgi:hypothetical protein